MIGPRQKRSSERYQLCGLGYANGGTLAPIDEVIAMDELPVWPRLRASPFFVRFEIVIRSCFLQDRRANE